MLYVYVTDQCREDAGRIGSLSKIEALRQKLTYEQSTLGLERHPPPFLKKPLGRTRVLMAEVKYGDDMVLCFLRHVYKKDIESYDTFLSSTRVPQADDPEIVAFLKEARATPVITKDPPSDLESDYLFLDREREVGQLKVLESPIWIGAMRTMKETQGKQGLLTPVWEVLQKICDDAEDELQGRSELRHDRHDVVVLYRYFPASHSLFLIAPLEGGAPETASPAVDARKLLDESANFDETQLLRNAARAYPDFILYDREIWESTQASIDANLALSPEESEVLSDVLDPTTEGGFPLFINGRPGSGKSTILQYLFAEYLHAHLARPAERRLACPPLYLTYNDRLVENARRLVTDIFHCGAEKLAASEPVDTQDERQRAEFDRSFVYFREFLLTLVDGEGFDQSKYVDFRRFKALYVANLSQAPDPKLRRLAPEVAWHTLRTYIKGKNAGESEYFDPESYAELPRNEVTVTADTYELVWEKIWNGWYRTLCQQEGYWDDQDLARRVLDLDLVTSEYPAIFCDEAQDFTTVELELIFRLSCFSAKRIEPHLLSRIPYAFAGDPFQTLNPTGFRWDAIKANFHDNIARQLDPDHQGKIGFTFKELAYNYRSTTSIVRFCNLIQLKRAELFDIRDVAPQTAWAIDKGAWPAYFELDLGTQGKLRDQSELVIIVPCQEGGEKAFVEGDEYLKTIALDTKGEVSRSVLSPMRAKGLEFQRVVLYKFGAKAVSDDLVTVMAKITAKRGSQLEREQTLGLEYFFNGAYVGASRAQRRLLVVDTQPGLDQFWSFATDASAIEGLLTERRRAVWSEQDLHHMMRGDASTWSEDRDDPKALADRFFEQGKLEQSPYLLQLARNQYEALGDVERKERCTALIHDLEGEFLEAAASYKQLGEPEEAIRCYWEAQSYAEVNATSAHHPGRFNTTPLVLAGLFMSRKPTPERALQFVSDLAAGSLERMRTQFRYSHWADVMQEAVKAMVGDDKHEPRLDRDNAAKAFSALSRMQSDAGLPLRRTRQLAFLAFCAGEEVSALEVWNDVKHGPKEKDPEFILRARAMTTPYPQRLKWYSQLNDFFTIVAEYRSRASEDLEDEYRDVVLKALLREKDFYGAVELARSGVAWNMVRSLLAEFPVSEAKAASTRALLGIFLRRGVERGEFRQVFEDMQSEKTAIKVMDAILSDEDALLGVYAALLKLLARSQSLVEERSDDKFIARTIRTIANKRASRLKDLVTPEEVGAALERAGRMDIALAFYESVFSDKQWGDDRGTELNAKARWLKCKQRQADLDRKDERRRSQRLSEAKRRSASWGVDIPKEQYPNLSGLALNEIDVLLGAGSTSTVLPEPSPHASERGSSKAKLPTAVPESRSVQPAQEPVRGAAIAQMPEEAANVAQNTPAGLEQGALTLPLPKRPALSRRVEFSYSYKGVKVKAKLLPARRRLELVNEDNEETLLIRVADHLVESLDLEVTALGDGQWMIGSWALNVSLAQTSPDTTIVDLWGDEGPRILCLAV